MNTLGTLLRLTSYGESHGAAVGAVLDGFPARFEVDVAAIQEQLDRRRPGGKLQSARKEADRLLLDSGVHEGITTGAPIHFRIENSDARSKDYDPLKDIYRPGHADYTYEAKYGHRDHRGGGRSSARITAAWVAAGALAQQYLATRGVRIASYVCGVGPIRMEGAPAFFERAAIDASEVRCPSPEHSAAMVKAIEAVRSEGDSLGGIVQTVISGVPAGWGEPLFDKLGAKLGHAMLSINAVKGFEIGAGFAMSAAKGSEMNDAFDAGEGEVRTLTNHSGGILGGISNGMDLHFRTAFKPTASIRKGQRTVDRGHASVELSTEGRHDPCVVPRAVPIVEAMSALVLMDALLLHAAQAE